MATHRSQFISSAPPSMSVKLQRALALVHGMQALRLRGGLVERSGGVRPCMFTWLRLGYVQWEVPDELR